MMGLMPLTPTSVRARSKQAPDAAPWGTEVEGGIPHFSPRTKSSLLLRTTSSSSRVLTARTGSIAGTRPRGANAKAENEQLPLLGFSLHLGDFIHRPCVAQVSAAAPWCVRWPRKSEERALRWITWIYKQVPVTPPSDIQPSPEHTGSVLLLLWNWISLLKVKWP